MSYNINNEVLTDEVLSELELDVLYVFSMVCMQKEFRDCVSSINVRDYARKGVTPFEKRVSSLPLKTIDLVIHTLICKNVINGFQQEKYFDLVFQKRRSIYNKYIDIANKNQSSKDFEFASKIMPELLLPKVYQVLTDASANEYKYEKIIKYISNEIIVRREEGYEDTNDLDDVEDAFTELCISYCMKLLEKGVLHFIKAYKKFYKYLDQVCNIFYLGACLNADITYDLNEESHFLNKLYKYLKNDYIDLMNLLKDNPFLYVIYKTNAMNLLKIIYNEGYEKFTKGINELNIDFIDLFNDVEKDVLNGLLDENYTSKIYEEELILNTIETLITKNIIKFNGKDNKLFIRESIKSLLKNDINNMEG